MKIHGLYFMSANEILQQLAVLVVCHGLAVGQITSHYFLVQRPMPWVKAREFCQRHYVDLAVLSTEEQYFKILNAMPANKASFWLGLQRQSVSSEWQWVNGEELSYEHWYRKNHEGHCASLEAMLEKSKKLLPRYCMEPHMIVCQGPDSPQSVTVDSVGTDHVNLKWNISAFMQMTPHSYNVKMCTSLCETHYFFSTNGSTDMSINISNLTSATEYFLEISAFVVRPDRVTGGKIILQTNPTVVQFKTVDHWKQHKIITGVLKLIKLVSLGPPLWILYCILKKGHLTESENDTSPVELSVKDTVVDLIPMRTRGAVDHWKQHKIITGVLKLIKLVSLGPPLWILYCILKKGHLTESENDTSPVELSVKDTVVDLIPMRTRGAG